jgi:shikimate kinase/3-dehydroquinate synthase
VREGSVEILLGERSYVVDVAAGAAQQRLRVSLEALSPTRVVVVTDDVVAPLVLPGLEPAFLGFVDTVRVVIPAGEKHKTLATVETILRAAVEAPVDRDALMVGVGGGVVTDITGLAAALALRGLRWIAVPTTLLSMVDASVGGKTAVDLGSAKNAIGAFHQPSAVIVDPVFTRTESARAFRSGLAELLKTALVGDRGLYDTLRAPGGAERLSRDRDIAATTAAIRASIKVKASVVGRDEKEHGERAHLNLGHTIGHALEAEGGFERLTHGEAVSLGLVAALRVGVRLGVTPSDLAHEIIDVQRRLGLPVDLDSEPLQSALRWATFDKKRRGGSLRIVLVREPGRLEIRELDPSNILGFLERSDSI